MRIKKSYLSLFFLVMVACGNNESSKNPIEAEEISSSLEDVIFSSSGISSSSEESVSFSSNGNSSSSKGYSSSSSGISSSSEESISSSSNGNSSSSKGYSSSSSGISSSSEESISSSSNGNSSSSKGYSSSSSGISSSSEESVSSSSNGNSSSSKGYSSSSSGISSSSKMEFFSSSATIPSKLYDCEIYKCVTTTHLNPNIDYGEYLDVRDSQVYRTVQIGEQVWMAQNLNWNTKGSYCLANNSLNCKSKGHMYPWSIAQSACPDGWHLPDTADFAYLKFYVKQNNGGIGVGTSLKKGANDIFGFSSLVNGGYQTGSNGQFSESDKMFYWTNSEDADNKIYAHVRYLKNSSENLCYETIRKTWSLSVRCIKD